MKTCAYCGRENPDEEARCKECGTFEFVAQDLSPAPRKRPVVAKLEVLPRDRPKVVIVAGAWMIYGLGLLGNILVFLAVMTGNLGGPSGVVCFLFSLGGGTLCAYLIYRAGKNYSIHKKRAKCEGLT